MSSAADPAVADRVHAALRDVLDPELGLDVVSLGLIYDIRNDDRELTVDMTLTTPGCPVSEQLPGAAAAALRRALPELAVEVRVVWEPPWTPERLTPERLTPEALDTLGFRRR